MIHMRKKCILICLIAAAMMLFAGIAQAATGTVTASSLILRKEANSQSEALYSIHNGSQVTIVSKHGDWYKVTYGKYEGYVYADYIKVADDDALQKGSKGAAVKAVQERLKQLGYYSATCDGNYGNVTVTAVKAFQTKNGLTVDGIVDKDTLKKLESDTAISAKGTVVSNNNNTVSDGTLKKGDKGAEVKKLQERLKALGYYTSTCDSSYGNVTVAAVKAFQAKNGLNADGVAGVTTQKKLYSADAVPAKGNTTAAAPEKDDGTLQKGDKGAEVKKLQQRLKELGYYTPSVDSDYGYRTVEAVKAFQKKNGLTADGVAGPSTQKKLYSTSAIPANQKEEDTTTLKSGDKGDAVKKLQQRLKELGYYSNTVDSQYGYRTVEAVKAFQKKNSLTADGVANAATQKKLYSTSAIPANQQETESTTLKSGDKGAEVKKLQERLKVLGYYTTTVDSQYGYRTVEAVKQFQIKNSLTADGVANAATQKKLYSTSAIPANQKDEDTSTLKSGDQGEAVKKLQQRLKELGYYTPGVDGSYGYRTVEAIKAFQKKNGLTADGVAGPSTQTKLFSTSAIPANAKDEAEETPDDGTLKKGDKGAEVKKLQQRLKELGYYTYTCDSDYGYRTVEAVKAFQKRNGLTADGVAGPSTQKKLYSTSAVAAKDPEQDKEEEDKNDGTLKKGDKGAEVKKLQQRLKELGYYTYTCDSDYGYRTVEAIKAFQKKNGLTSDGVAGPYTQAKLYSASAIPAKDAAADKEEDKTDNDGTLRQGASGAEVKKLQERLKELGYYTYGIDSSYGAQTVEAVKAFQKKNGLTADGVAGTATQNKLYSASAIPAKDSSDETLNTSKTLKSGDSGAQVKALQTRLKELGYYTSVIDSDYGYQTASAVSAFQKKNGLTVTGTADTTTLKKLVSSSAIAKNDKTEEDDDDKEVTYVTKRLDWFAKGSSVFKRNAIIQIKDVKTGLVFKGKVLYGTNHLDVEPLTAADTAILLKINGGVDFKATRRPMLVLVNGSVYAASIYSEPHGEQTITNNNFDGQFCLHFYGSKTHGTKVVDSEHQRCEAEALKHTW